MPGQVSVGIAAPAKIRKATTRVRVTRNVLASTTSTRRPSVDDIYLINNLPHPATVVTAADRTVTIPDYRVTMPESLVTLYRSTQAPENGGITVRFAR
jgi:hypothetical protein